MPPLPDPIPGSDAARKLDAAADTTNQFIEWLESDDRSPTPLELDAAFRETVEHVNMTGRKGTLTLKIEVKPGRKDLGYLEVACSVDTKLSHPAPDSRAYFATPDGGLSRDDPNRPQLPFPNHGDTTDE